MVDYGLNKLVVPAKAGTQDKRRATAWTPAFAGVTKELFDVVTPRMLVLGLLTALSGCSYFQLVDPYGNVYGDFYNPGSTYRWQMLACEQEVDTDAVPGSQRKNFMRCCMGAHGVPIPDLASCPAMG